jgi:riboflavin biosynthesis pyrimidine reductase
VHRLYPLPAVEVDPAHAYAVPPGRFLRANMVSSVDGAAYLEGRSGGLSGPADRELFHLLRSLADVVLVGAGTVTAEGYGPARVTDAHRERRSAAGQAEVPPIAVVSARLQLDFGARFFAEAAVRPIVITGEQAPAERMAQALEVADVIATPGAGIDLPAALETLADQGYEHVLCEGGPVLLARLLACRAVDELCLTLTPLVVGGAARRIVDGVLPRPARVSLTALLADGGFVFTRYAVERTVP